MHSAPAVAYPVARSPRVGRALALLAVLSAVPGLWWASQGAPTLSAMCVLMAWAGAAWLAIWQWWRQPQGWLRWDGQAWWWVDGRGERAVQPRVRLDLQQVLLVQTAGAAGWHWLEAGQQPALWSELRRALYGPPVREQMAAGSV